MARGGQMVDATIVPVPKQRNSRDENETVKAGQTPSDWEKKPAKLRQKDRDARWTKKHGKSFFGYKNHVNADAKHKLIRRYEVTDAAVHDSQPLDALLTKGNTSTDVFADSAYRSAEIEAKLKGQGLQQPYSSACQPQPSTVECANASEPRQEQNPRSHRACIRRAGEFGGRPDRAHDRHRAGARQDRLAELGLQHSPPRDTGPDGRGMRRSLPAAPHGAGGQTRGSRLGDRWWSNW